MIEVPCAYCDRPFTCVLPAARCMAANCGVMSVACCSKADLGAHMAKCKSRPRDTGDIVIGGTVRGSGGAGYVCVRAGHLEYVPAQSLFCGIAEVPRALVPHPQKQQRLLTRCRQSVRTAGCPALCAVANSLRCVPLRLARCSRRCQPSAVGFQDRIGKHQSICRSLKHRTEFDASGVLCYRLLLAVVTLRSCLVGHAVCRCGLLQRTAYLKRPLL